MLNISDFIFFVLKTIALHYHKGIAQINERYALRLFFNILFILLFSQIVAYNDTKINTKIHREKLRRLVEKKVPYDPVQMKEAILEFQVVDEEWKRLEQEHLEYRNQFT